MAQVENFLTYSEHHSRERLAWAVLLAAFSLCVVISISVPIGANWFLHNATGAQAASIQGSSATTLIVTNRTPAPLALRAGAPPEQILEGSTIATDSTSQAIVTLFDRSQITVLPNSEVTLTRMRRPRFRRSSRPNEVVASVTRGRVRIIVPSPGDRASYFEVTTPQAHAVLEPGSFMVEVNNDVSHITVRAGRVTVNGQTGQRVMVEEGLRSEIRLGQSASEPLAAPRDLLENGDFEDLLTAAPTSEGPVARGWWAYNAQGGDGGEVSGHVAVGTWSNRRAIRFYRSGSNNNHGETGVKQPLDNKYVGDYRSLRFRAEVNIVNQSLSGGGYLSSEFPIILRVNYRDTYGNENHWTQGFYYQNPHGYHIENGLLLARDTWYTYESPNLKELVPDLAYISSVQVYASGWDYDALVSELSLISQ